MIFLKPFLNKCFKKNFFIRMVRRRKPGKKRRGRGSTDSVSSGQSMPSPEQVETEESLQNKSLDALDGSARAAAENCEDQEPEALLRLPEMTDTSMDSVGQPLRDVMDRLNGVLDGKNWEGHEEEAEDCVSGIYSATSPLQHQPFREDAGGEPPDPDSQSCLVASAASAQFYCFTPYSADAVAESGSHHDSAGNGQSQTVYSGHEDEREGETTEQDASSKIITKHRGDVEMEQPNGPAHNKSEENGAGSGQGESSHPAEFRSDHGQQLLIYALPILSVMQRIISAKSKSSFPFVFIFRVDNNHLLLLMIHVFRENEEQLLKVHLKQKCFSHQAISLNLDFH